MTKANLMLHCGAKNVTRERLEATVTPAHTETWYPIPHATLLNEVQARLTASGLHVVTEAHGLTADGARYFGLMQVANGTNPDDFGLVVGLRNSHDKKFPAGLVVGASVFVCDNLSFSSEIKITRKHTVHIFRDLPRLITRAVGQLADHRGRQEQRFAAYLQHDITNAQAHDLLIQALDAQVVPVTKIPDVLAEWRAPRHPEFANGGLTAWRLFNAVTEIAKGNLEQLPKRTQSLHGILDAVCSVAAKETPLTLAS
jgi:Domain of unknown function (DUF932)